MSRLVEPDNWNQQNRNYLIAVFDHLHELLQMKTLGTEESPKYLPQNIQIFEKKLRNIAETMSCPPALEQLCQGFGLSEFERCLLVFCAALEIDSRFADLCETLHGIDRFYHLTFSLALSVLPNPHWSALAPDAPLRYWKLLYLGAGSALTQTSLHLDERILHYLVGVKTQDPVLAGLSEISSEPKPILPSHQSIVNQMMGIWQLKQTQTPLIQLLGPDLEDKISLAHSAFDHLGRKLCFLNCQCLPLNIDDLASFLLRLERECMLEGLALFLNCEEFQQIDSQQQIYLNQLLEDFKQPIIIAVRSPLQNLKRQTLRLYIPKPSPQEQLMTWELALAELKAQLQDQSRSFPSEPQLIRDLQDLISQFHLSTSMIQKACIAAMAEFRVLRSPQLKPILWNCCRIQARPGLDDLAERIESQLTWDDIVIPPLQQETLREMIVHVQHKSTVYESWGFATKNRRGLGITALFSGPSGTGKTLAAGVIANELNLDLYKIELSSVVSKYIGETEKNLQRIFDAAESGGVILLFDEADSIFGKRSEVKDSKDRHANLEVSYLLQRMESYPGLAILTTNLQSNLDPAFLRRLRFVTQFSLPDMTHRSNIWQRVFPAASPQQGLDFDKLAQLNAPGGNIRMIALNAAFLAADEGEPIQMKHLLRATQSEYEKLGKSLTSFEVSGWLEAC